MTLNLPTVATRCFSCFPFSVTWWTQLNAEEQTSEQILNYIEASRNIKFIRSQYTRNDHTKAKFCNANTNERTWLLNCYNILTLLIYYAINWNCELPLQAMRSVQGEIHKQPIYKQMITIRKWRSLLHRIFAMQMHITSLKMECTICNKLELQITVTGNEKCPKVRYI